MSNTWNYRVLRVAYPDGTFGDSFHEVYYDAEGNITSWTVDAVSPWTDEEGGFAWILGKFVEATKKPTLLLSEDGDTLTEIET